MNTTTQESSKSVAQVSPQGGGEIIASNIAKTYGAGPLAMEVVKDCSFTIESNKLTVMIGPSGCGKSSLIQIIAGFEKPTSGDIQ